MNDDLSPYLDAGIERLQDGANTVSGQAFARLFRALLREIADFLADLMSDQPALWMTVAFVVGLFFGKTLTRPKKPFSIR